MTLYKALADGRKRLKPALDAELILANILKTTRSTLLAMSKLELSGEISPDAAACYEAALEKRERGFSVAAITGRKEFRYLELAVNGSVLIPRPETETLVEAALDWIKANRSENSGEICRCLDLCTGSGAVALALLDEAPLPLDMTACDIDDNALCIAQKNHAKLCAAASLNIVKSDLFSQISGKFHLITANPPYVPSGQIANLAREVQNEPRLALDGGADGLDIIRKICAAVPSYLYPGGAVFIEADPRQTQSITALMEKAGLKFAGIRRDLSGKPRVISGILSI